ncbi:MAG: isoprenyl transferase [Chitinophagales bacterium]|nr:MAG: isoprenyl transferase [Chitinophagales bacterium]
MNDLKARIDLRKLPTHIAIIMDGNGRWAKRNNRPRVFGHRNGVKTVKRITEVCATLGIKYLTLYAFSTENWARPKSEVSALMDLLVRSIKSETKTLMKNNIRLRAIGNLKTLPPKTYHALQEAIELTRDNTKMTLILALSYSARWELTEACRAIAREAELGNISSEQINEQVISAHLATAPYPDPELLIRTSGEQRISNFLLWQLAYTELYFTETLWPDFMADDLYKAIITYQQRERRFGKISEQIKVG